jgi:hypothetical protein
MSSSSLVTYTKLSQNCTKPRNHKIDTISIHCFVGQVTAEEGLNASRFTKYNPVSGASCNYIVGRDGSIGLCVEEENRSWCSSSRSNDHRAITIEVASEIVHPYKVTEDAYNSLVKLIADICERNGIKKLLWKADKSLIGKVDEQNMTVHRWFKNKACPGDYLYNLHGDIAEKVNRIICKEEPKKEEKEPEVLASPYFKKYNGNSVSIVNALNSIGEKSSYSYRKKIAKANGIKLYVGSASQNKKMVSLLKKGELIKP